MGAVVPEHDDVLGVEPDERSPGRRRAAATLVALAVAGAVGDRQVRAAEFDALLAQAVVGQGAIGYADRRIGATVQYASPVLGSSDTPLHVRKSLEGIVQDEARQQAAVLRVRHAASAAVRVLPWHDEQREARQAYAAYLAAKARYLEAVAVDFETLYGRPPELTAQLTAAARALDAAAPSARAALAARQLLLGRTRGLVTARRVSP